MRCVQLYWQAKAITLANKIYRLLPDPTRSGDPVRLMLPSASLANLQLDVEADYSWYQLLQAEYSEIEAWASKEGISYPFNHFQELFIETLKIDFEISLRVSVPAKDQAAT
mgnify:CR=1 FL=1